MLNLERLEDRCTPAVLDITSGVLTFLADSDENNNLTVQYNAGSYAFNDSVASISLGSGAIAAGWRGSGTHTVTGSGSSVDSIGIAVGDGTNTVNLRQTAASTTIDGGSDTTTVNINSVAPSTLGNLAGIQADVTVNAGTAMSLNVSDYLGQSRPDTVVIGPSSITGLGSHAINYSGTLSSLVVGGSNLSTLTESYKVNSPPAAYFRLNCNGGSDSVTVTGDTTGDVYLGSGDDTLTVLSGVTLTGNVHTGTGTDNMNYGEPTYGTITGTVVP